MTTEKRVTACQDNLQQLVAKTSGINEAAVVTSDGFEVASTTRGQLSVEKLAAMASALLALSEALASEMGMKHCKHVIIDTESGPVLVLRIPVQEEDLLMCVLCNTNTSLGAVLYSALNSAKTLGEELNNN